MSSSTPPRQLGTTDHDRNVAGLTYVYPVVSRRAGGVSLGINLNPNNACNFRCVYCQVPELKRGAGPRIDLAQLQHELDQMLDAILEGDYLQQHVPEPWRRLADVAFSGNGEPTSSPDFAACIELAAATLRARKLVGSIEVVLITNGSLMHRPEVLRGLDELARVGGQVWFKLDAIDDARRRLINDTPLSTEHIRRNLQLAASRCRTRLQTCVLALDGNPPSAEAIVGFAEFVAGLVQDGMPIEDVLLYGPERPSLQPEAPRISKVPPECMDAIAAALRERGVMAHRYQ